MVIAGQALRSAAMIHAATNFSHSVAFHKRDTHQLVTNGIYGYVATSISGFALYPLLDGFVTHRTPDFSIGPLGHNWCFRMCSLSFFSQFCCGDSFIIEPEVCLIPFAPFHLLSFPCSGRGRSNQILWRRLREVSKSSGN